MNNNKSEREEYLYQSWGSSTDILWSYPIIDYVSLFRMKLVKELIGYINGKMAIDIGCGNGSISLLLWLLGAEVSSIDTSIEALQVTRNIRSLSKDSVPVENLQMITRNRDLGERIQKFRTNLCQSDAMQLPYKEETFDFVCCLETLEFVQDDMPAIREIERITKMGGIILLFVPYDRRADSEAKSLGYYRRYSFKTIKEKMITSTLDLKRFIFWYFPMLKLLDLIRLRYIYAAIGLWIEAFFDRKNSHRSRNLRNRDVFIHSLTRFYQTKFWHNVAMPLMLRLLNLNKLFQHYPYSDARSHANDVFLILKKTHKPRN
jgi:ubiquinone/menaquinone biosynthesis C-methylase UbiE